MATAVPGRPVRSARRETSTASRERSAGAATPGHGRGEVRPATQCAWSPGPNGLCRSTTSRPVTGSPSVPSTAEPGGVAHDVEARVGRLPAGGQAGPQQPVHLGAAQQFLAQVLPAGVGDAQPQGELQHGGGTGPVDGAHGGGRVPGVAERAEVAQQPGLEQRPHGGPVADVTRLPGVQRQRRGAVGQLHQPGTGEGGEQIGRGDRAAALGPGGVRGEQRRVARRASAAGRSRAARASRRPPRCRRGPRGLWAPGAGGGRGSAPAPSPGRAVRARRDRAARGAR